MLRPETYESLHDADHQELRDLRKALANLLLAYDRWSSPNADFPVGRPSGLIADEFDDPRRAAIALAHAALLMHAEGRANLRDLYDAVSSRLLREIEKAEEAQEQ